MAKEVMLGVIITFEDDIKDGDTSPIASRVLVAIADYVNHSESGLAPEENITRKITVVGANVFVKLEEAFGVL